MLCPHGINTKHKHCDLCEEVARAEARGAAAKQAPKDFSFFDLDKYNLDKEWVEQPKLYFQHAERLAEARAKWEALKADRDLVHAEEYLKIKKDPNAYDLAKPTEEAVKSCVLTQKAYKRATAKVIQAKHEVDVLQAAVDALDHRRRALEKLVDLYLASYFAKPTKPKGDAARDHYTKVERDAAFGHGRKPRGDK